MGVWDETWPEIWQELLLNPAAPPDLFCELYRELSTALVDPPSVELLADIVDSPTQSAKAFEAVRAVDLEGERALVSFLEASHGALEDFAGDPLSNAYFVSLSIFLDKYSLRYDLRRPCQLCPSLPGVFASLFRELQSVTGADPHLRDLMWDFESAVRDLSSDASEMKIKTCISKQMNLLEGLGSQHADVTKTTLGAICNELGTWPHTEIRDAMKSVYKFSCDYPGIRHGGTPGSNLRRIDMRDMVAVSIVLMGFVPYLTDQLPIDAGYRVL